MFRPQPRYAPDPRFIHHRNGISEFQTSPRMSKLVANMPPNRVRSPTDHHFASGCSPPRLLATQLPSTTWLWFTMARTSSVQIKRLPGRTHSWSIFFQTRSHSIRKKPSWHWPNPDVCSPIVFGEKNKQSETRTAIEKNQSSLSRFLIGVDCLRLGK